MKYFPFHIDEWEGGVVALGLAERGAYITVLARIFRTGGPVKLTCYQWGKLMGCSPPTAHRYLEVLKAGGKLTLTEAGALTNAKAEAVLMSAKVSYAIKQSIPKMKQTISNLERTKRVQPCSKKEKRPPNINKDIKEGKHSLTEALTRLKRLRSAKEGKAKS
jgi:hypothetical protein